MVFIKGGVPWNKGLHRNLNPNGGFQKGIIPWNKGTKGLMSKTKPDSFKEYRRKAWTGKNNPMWKHTVGYSAVHKWLITHNNKTNICTKCQKHTKTEWANITGIYQRDIKNFVEMCVNCHRRFDKSPHAS